MQSISFRNAFWAEIDAEVDGYLPHQTLVPDLIHPSKRGVQLLGDLVIKFLTEAQQHMSRLGHGSHTSPSHLPPPLYTDAAMDDQSNTCTRGDALQDMMVHTVDWYWVDGKKPGGLHINRCIRGYCACVTDAYTGFLHYSMCHLCVRGNCTTVDVGFYIIVPSMLALGMPI